MGSSAAADRLDRQGGPDQHLSATTSQPSTGASGTSGPGHPCRRGGSFRPPVVVRELLNGGYTRYSEGVASVVRTYAGTSARHRCSLCPLRRLSARLGPLRLGLSVERVRPSAGEPPYEALLREAEQSGTVLHRENIYRSGEPVDAISDEILAFVLDNVGETVLDIGCGAGPYVARLNSAGKRCVGVDLDPRAVAQAQALRRPVLRMSANALAFDDNAFDSVMLIETLEHLPEYERALAEATRVARTSVVVTVPDISVIPAMNKSQVVPWHLLEATHVNFFTPETLRTTLLQFTASCEVTRLGAFFQVDGQSLYMHAAAVARL